MEVLEKRIPELKSKLESLSCSSCGISLRKNHSIEKPGLYTIEVSMTDRINGKQAILYMYFDESLRATIENKYSYLYEAFDRINYRLEKLIEDILREWSNDGACER